VEPLSHEEVGREGTRKLSVLVPKMRRARASRMPRPSSALRAPSPGGRRKRSADFARPAPHPPFGHLLPEGEGKAVPSALCFQAPLPPGEGLG
jgi:hypothetical protein